MFLENRNLGNLDILLCASQEDSETFCQGVGKRAQEHEQFSETTQRRSKA
ncbi:hypothetical protein KDA_04500 [Dictyobacter alpinus]|uniref:Uncharacterized protein n=1 Tax=Dictyobacter alpinus TaxID=2014873 RepID=A0A402B0T8_9CHLR|nr:hypothetical protein KDA_04500 [Dictyobacter alpinus]